jgi:hypothetical protein
MRDFRDAKAMAKTIRAALAAKSLKISNGESLELIAKAFGVTDWNTLAAAIRAERLEKKVEAPVVEPATAPPTSPVPRRGVMFSSGLEASLHRSLALATARRHGYTTVEHLLLALTEDADAVAVLEACKVDVLTMKRTLIDYIDDDLRSLVQKEETEAPPTAGFHRVVQRMVIHLQARAGGEATGANILIAMLSERESHAYFFLSQQGMTQEDAVSFVLHGIRKGDAAA